MNCAAIVLAAGSSSRLGQPKQLLQHPRGTMLENAVSAAREANCEPIVVVTGAIDNSIRERLCEPTRTAHNADWAMGMGGSIRVGLAAVLSAKPDIFRTLILLSDQPALNGVTLRNLLRHWDDSTLSMIACRYGGSIGPPCGFDRAYFAELAACPVDRGAKYLLRPSVAVALMDWPAGAIDIDTPEDLQRWEIDQCNQT